MKLGKKKFIKTIEQARKNISFLTKKGIDIKDGKTFSRPNCVKVYYPFERLVKKTFKGVSFSAIRQQFFIVGVTSI